MRRQLIVRIRSAKDPAVLEELVNDVVEDIVQDGYQPGVSVTIQVASGCEPIYLALVWGSLVQPEILKGESHGESGQA